MRPGQPRLRQLRPTGSYSEIIKLQWKDALRYINLQSEKS
jgi:hypothetical protein